MKCSKCGSTEKLTEHHIHPVVFYGRKNNNLKICLCQYHHSKLEDAILAVESFIGNTTIGTRFKLERVDYEKILQSFLRDAKIVYVST